jgi:pimeloyl-ACP methyl ester carboxylesterase
MQMPLTTTEVSLSVGGTLAAFEAGAGPIILCVHGFPLDHTMWQGQLAGLADRFRVIAPDLRGFGCSNGSPLVVSLDDFVNDLCELLDHLAITDPVVLCGLSMGGYTAFRFAQMAPQRLAGLIFCDTRAAADTADVIANRHRMVDLVRKGGLSVVADAMHEKLFAGDTYTEQPALAEATRTVMMNARSETVAAALLAMAARPDATPQLGSLPVPSLWLCGSEDGITPPAEMQSNARSAPGSRFVEIPSAGHMAPLEQPASVNRAIASFMTSLEQR